MRVTPFGVSILFSLFCLAACSGSGSPSEPDPPPPPPPPVTANAIAILSVTPAPGQSLRVGNPIRVTFTYETVDASAVGCYLTKNGVRVSGGTGRIVGGNERGMLVSIVDIDQNIFNFLKPDKSTDAVVCQITKTSGLFEAVKSVSMSAIYFWHL